MRRGTVLRNLWQPTHESYLVYLGTHGEYSKCLWLLDGKFPSSGTHEESFYKQDILNDREHFPIVGYVDVDKVVHDAILAEVEEQEHE